VVCVLRGALKFSHRAIQWCTRTSASPTMRVAAMTSPLSYTSVPTTRMTKPVSCSREYSLSPSPSPVDVK
jgi:hypothetical protein